MRLEGWYDTDGGGDRLSVDLAEFEQFGQEGGTDVTGGMPGRCLEKGPAAPASA